jgi:hypothetical protein
VGCFFISAALAIGVLHQACITLVEGFTISGDAIVANVVDLASKS